MSTNLWRSVLGGVLLSFAGAAAAWGLIHDLPMSFAAAASAFVVGTVTWLLVLRSNPRPGFLAGALVGFATSIIAHLPLWAVVFSRESLPPGLAMGNTLIMSLAGSVFTAPVGVVAGLLTVVIARQRFSSAPHAS